MPRSPGRKGPGRPRKFKEGDVVYSPKYGHAVVVDFKNTEYETSYRLVRVLHPYNGAPYGEPISERSYRLQLSRFDKLPFRGTRKTVPGIYRANQRLVDRGCRCNCCVHEAIPKRMIRKDGTFRWEEEVSDEG